MTATTPTAEAVREALHDVLDPEFPISVIDLGLIRGVEVEGGVVRIRLTFTSLGCPCSDLIRDDIRDRVMQLPGVEGVEIEEVFGLWSREDISAAGLKTLKVIGVS